MVFKENNLINPDKKHAQRALEIHQEIENRKDPDRIKIKRNEHNKETLFNYNGYAYRVTDLAKNTTTDISENDFKKRYGVDNVDGQKIIPRLDNSKAVRIQTWNLGEVAQADEKNPFELKAPPKNRDLDKSYSLLCVAKDPTMRQKDYEAGYNGAAFPEEIVNAMEAAIKKAEEEEAQE